MKVACLGAGYFAQFHYGSWRRIEGVTLVGACDLDRAKAEATGAPAFTDLGAMLDAAKANVLDIILPPPGHAAAIRLALSKGVKWIICQKPFCTSRAEAEAITAEAEAAGARLIIHENFRFQPWYIAIKAQLEAGALGDVHQMTFRLRPGDGQGPNAYLDRQPYFQTMERFLVHETAVHLIDVFRYLFGDPQAVYADLRRLNPAIVGEDAGLILTDHPGGVRCVFDGNRHLDHASDNLRRTMGEALVEGTRGSLTLGGDGAVHLRRFGTGTHETILPPSASDTFGGDCVHAFQEHVAAAVQSGAPLVNTARSYLAVLRAEEAIYTSAQEGRKISLSRL